MIRNHTQVALLAALEAAGKAGATNHDLAEACNLSDDMQAARSLYALRDSGAVLSTMVTPGRAWPRGAETCRHYLAAHFPVGATVKPRGVIKRPVVTQAPVAFKKRNHNAKKITYTGPVDYSRAKVTKAAHVKPFVELPPNYVSQLDPDRCSGWARVVAP